MHYLDLFLIIISFVILIKAFFNGAVNETFSLINMVVIYVAGAYIWSKFGIANFLVFAVVYYLFIFIFKKIITGNIHKDSKNVHKNRIGGLFFGFVKLCLTLILIICVLDIVNTVKPDTLLNQKSIVIEKIKKSTPFINYYDLGMLFIQSSFESIIPQGSDESSQDMNNMDAASKDKKSIEDVKEDLQNNAAFQEVMNDKEIKDIIKSSNLKSNPAAIINLMKNPKIKNLINDPKIKDIMKNFNFKSMMEEIKKNQ